MFVVFFFTPRFAQGKAKGGRRPIWGKTLAKGYGAYYKECVRFCSRRPASPYIFSMVGFSSDSRFVLDDRFALEGSEAGPSGQHPTHNEPDGEDRASINSNEVAAGTGEDELLAGLSEGMDAAGFAGPSEKAVKPLTKEELAAFRTAQEGAGVIYISRIPPGMRPTKVRHLMGAYGEVGRVYLQPEGMHYIIAK